MGLFSGGGTPKYLKKQGKKILGEAWDVYNSTSFNPYEGEAVAPMNNVLSTAINNAATATNPGQGMFDQAVSTAQGAANTAAGYRPQQIQYTNVAPTTVAAAPTVAAPQMVTSQDVQAGSFLDANMDDYMNPYIRNVIDATMSDLNYNREVQRVADRASGAAAGAFTNDPRMQVLTAETTGVFDRTAAGTIADLYRTGYDTASNLAVGDIDRRYNAGVSNADRSLTAQGANQTAANEVALANAKLASEANMKQADINADAALADASGLLDASTKNADMGLAVAKLAADTGLDASQIMAYAGSQAGQQDAAFRKLALDAGLTQQQYDQLLPTFNYEQYVAEQDFPFKKMGLLTGAISSIGNQRSGSSVASGIGDLASGLGNFASGMKQR
jgi:hypothetical protein